MSKERTVEVDIRYHKNGNKRCEIPYLNGKAHGLARFWHENGRLYIESNWINGKQHRFTRFWHENGRLHREVNYKNGQMHGIRRVWGNSGSFCNFELLQKDILVFEFWFKCESKATAPKPDQLMFSTNQFLELCQKKL